MRVMGDRRTPGVQDQGHTDAGTQMPGIGGNRLQGLGSSAEQDGIDHCLVVIGDGTDRCRQGENQMVVLNGQEIRLARLKPLPGRTALTLGAVAVATGIVGNLYSGAVVTAQDMTAEAGTATMLNRRHHLQLAKADMTGVVLAPSWSVGAEDIRDLQRGARHARGLGGQLDLQVFQRAFHFMQEFGGDLAIAGSVLDLFVSQEHLDNADILMLLKQVRGEGMAQGMQRYCLIDIGGLACLMEGAVELPGRHRIDGILSRKKPATRQQLSLCAAMPPPGV